MNTQLYSQIGPKNYKKLMDEIEIILIRVDDVDKQLITRDVILESYYINDKLTITERYLFCLGRVTAVRLLTNYQNKDLLDSRIVKRDFLNDFYEEEAFKWGFNSILRYYYNQTNFNDEYMIEYFKRLDFKYDKVSRILS